MELTVKEQLDIELKFLEINLQRQQKLVEELRAIIRLKYAQLSVQ